MNIMRLNQTLFYLMFGLAFGWASHAPADPGMAGPNAPHPSRHESKRLRGEAPERLPSDERERLRGDLEQFSQQQPHRASAVCAAPHRVTDRRSRCAPRRRTGSWGP